MYQPPKPQFLQLYSKAEKTLYKFQNLKHVSLKTNYI